MATDKHPYVTSAGGLIQVITHLRGSFPTMMSADTLKKLGYAPKNESYIVSTLRFLGLIDKDGNKTDPAAKAFSQHQDKDFQHMFDAIVKEAYKELFTLYAEKTWSLDAGQLITFFRQNDQSSAIVGKRQASTFITLAGLAGHRDIPEAKNLAKGNNDQKPRSKVTPVPKRINTPQMPTQTPPSTGPKQRDVGLTVRVEINLPAEGTQETYNRIFKSIKENLLNA